MPTLGRGLGTVVALAVLAVIGDPANSDLFDPRRPTVVTRLVFASEETP
jgi:hypothetical protein